MAKNDPGSLAYFASQYLVLLRYSDECGISAKGALTIYVGVATKRALDVQCMDHVYIFVDNSERIKQI